MYQYVVGFLDLDSVLLPFSQIKVAMLQIPKVLEHFINCVAMHRTFVRYHQLFSLVGLKNILSCLFRAVQIDLPLVTLR